MKIIYVFTFLFLLSACYKGKTVDLIIHNANVKVLNDQMETSEAIAIADGKIIEVGPERQILNKYTASNIINAQKKDVLPGFHDAHGHLMSLARQRLNVDLRGTQSEYEMIARLEKHHQKHKQQVLVGRGWDQSLWGEEKMPNNDLLNERFKDLPVAVTRIDGHAMLINQAMMKHLGITDSTEVKGGKFIKSGGKFTGILLDHALDLVNKNLPKPTNAALKKELIQIQEDLIATGITHVHEAGLSAEDRDLLIEMAENNELLIHVYGMLFPSKKTCSLQKKTGISKLKTYPFVVLKLLQMVLWDHTVLA
ncbi:hypothetical protein CW751_07415 [Brumimicrobium salinarum]|uniref:Amidohydrolase 3 domain-containing protein n=1 Tax=Brumimicrobium salinarum TaxID=2058658 RepID=A0A2I0R333_9FLAO|nr:amidohydrolase family protein [Brumimicrobium salinarum]PKR80986.1 hypothetical protein CW751_07415 [Brumimicrobium salinarum]